MSLKPITKNQRVNETYDEIQSLIKEIKTELLGSQ